MTRAYQGSLAMTCGISGGGGAMVPGASGGGGMCAGEASSLSRTSFLKRRRRYREKSDMKRPSTSSTALVNLSTFFRKLCIPMTAGGARRVARLVRVDERDEDGRRIRNVRLQQCGTRAGATEGHSCAEWFRARHAVFCLEDAPKLMRPNTLRPPPTGCQTNSLQQM